MKLPQLSEVQFQASAQSKAFDPLQLPDPNPQLSQNLSIIQQSFSNLAQSGKINAAADYTSDPTFMEQFAELLPKAMETATQLQNIDVAIQMARADDRYYQMLQQGLIPENGEAVAIEQNMKQQDQVVKGAAAQAAPTANYDTVRGILNFSNHGEITLRRRVAKHMFTNVYPDWMNTQLEINDSTVMVEDGEGNMVEVAINQKDLPDYQHKQIMSHLRTAFMGHNLLSDTNNDLIQKEMAIGFTTDAKISREYSRNTRANDGTKRFTAGYTNMFEQFKAGNVNALGEFQVEAASMYDKKGVNLINTPKEFFNRLIADVGTAAENGAEFPIGEFIKKARTSDGQLLMERAPLQARLLMRTYRDKRRTYLANKQKADKQDLIFSIAEFNKQSLEQPMSVSDFVAFKKIVSQRALEIGISDTDLLKSVDRGMALASLGADARNQLREDAEIALATGNASQSADYYLDPIVGPEVREKVDRQVERVKSPEYKVNSEEISSTIGQSVRKTMVDPLGNLKGQAVQVNAYYQRIYDSKYAELMEQNRTAEGSQKLTSLAIANQARDAALTQWEKDSKDPKAPYYVNPKNGSFPNFPSYAADANETAFQNNVASIVSEGKTTAGVQAAIRKQPQLILDAEETSAAISTFEETGRIDPKIKRAAKLINQSVGRIVISNPMQLVYSAAQGYGQMKPNLKPEEVPQHPVFLERAATDAKRRQWMKDLVGLESDLYTQPAKYGPVAQMPTRAGMPPVVPVFKGGEPQGLQGLTPSDYRELAFIVSGEAARGTDDEYAVAASAINRLADGRFGKGLYEIARRPGQYEAVFGTKTARYEKELIEKLSSPEGQKKIAQMLIALEGRTDFKGQTQLGNRDPDNDPMFDSRGNFYHYAGQTGKGPYTGTINRNYLRFIR